MLSFQDPSLQTNITKAEGDQSDFTSMFANLACLYFVFTYKKNFSSGFKSEQYATLGMNTVFFSYINSLAYFEV